MVDGGFFLVDRCISEESFAFSRTTISAENTERIILLSEVSKGLVAGVGAGKGTACL